MGKFTLKDVKYALYRLIDAISIEREYDSLKHKCNNFDFAENVRELARREQDHEMFFISYALSEILSEEKGLWAMLTRHIGFRKKEHFDYYPYVLKIKGYEKNQEFYCLVQMFNSIGAETADTYASLCSSLCGYSQYLDIFYIDL